MTTKRDNTIQNIMTFDPYNIYFQNQALHFNHYHVSYRYYVFQNVVLPDFHTHTYFVTLLSTFD